MGSERDRQARRGRERDGGGQAGSAGGREREEEGGDSSETRELINRRLR